MKNILLILTGGTIGSCSRGGALSVRKEGSILLDLYNRVGKSEGISFDILRPLNILSENATAGDIIKIINTAAGADFNKYDGIVMTYGTDTLAYCANLAAMALHNSPVPVVFVAADKPPEEEGSNALANFSAAVDFISTEGLNGVYFSYRNPGEETKIHLASRVTQAAPVTGDFNSVANLHFGTVREGRFTLNTSPRNPTPERIKEKAGFPLPISQAPPKILYIKPTPYTDFGIYGLQTTAAAAAVIELYHSGTGSAEGEASLAEFIKRCSARNIPAVLASYPYTDGRKYVTTEALEKAGGIFAYRMSPEAALAKTVAYFLGKKEISLAEYLARDLFYEIIE
ncbi:MAG TPA: asparaginase domain-containing protein [Clostridia bacterium]|jgi:L-asparaginase|nr:asparaginase domain-containing protein [Clostridia bacterium]HOK82067.1 asparaginase domain-containing protein [Clostridia bacterium]HOL61297.1 asparaginase domain-containing protein [Clostridia bacterium]